MTTIAFDGSIFASDSRISGHFIDQHGFDKIRVVEQHGKTLVVSGCGELQLLCAFFAYMQGEIEEFPLSADNEFSAMVYNVDDQKLILYENRMIPITIYPPYAIGSGSDFAMGAMLAKCNAKEAVQIAAKLDSATGGDIKFIDTNTLHNSIASKKEAQKTRVQKDISKKRTPKKIITKARK